MRVDSERQASRPVSADHHHAVAQPPSVIMNSDMEAFGNRLSAIVNADFYNAALNAGPVDVPLGMLLTPCLHHTSCNISFALARSVCMMHKHNLSKLCNGCNSLPEIVIVHVYMVQCRFASAQDHNVLNSIILQSADVSSRTFTQA